MVDLVPQELRVLSAVEARGSFTAAAAELGLTQSAVSHAVRACERKLGAVLFQRGRRGATTTEAGNRVVGQARQILRLLETLPSVAQGAETGEVAGTVRIAAFRSVATQLLPGILGRLTEGHPALTPQVTVVRDIGRGSAGEVLDGNADIAITTVEPTSRVPEGLLSGRLLTESYWLAAPVGVPDPRSLPLIDWDENCSSYTRQWWDAQDWIPAATITAEDDGAVLSMVASGLGMAIMPELTLHTAPDTVARIDLGEDRPVRHIGYVTTPDMAKTLPVRTLIRQIRTAVAASRPGTHTHTPRQAVSGLSA